MSTAPGVTVSSRSMWSRRTLRQNRS